MNEYGVVAFASTHNAMLAEKALRELFHIQMMPTPRTISASCGIALQFLMSEREQLALALCALLPDNGYRIYPKENQDGN